MMWRTEKSAERPGFDLSGYPISSDGELDYRHNDLGRLGEQIGAFRTRTATVAASAGVTFELTPRLDLQTSVAFGRGYRQIIDRFEPTIRSEERRVGKECVSTCRSRWSSYHRKKKETNTIFNNYQTQK